MQTESVLLTLKTSNKNKPSVWGQAPSKPYRIQAPSLDEIILLNLWLYPKLSSLYQPED